MGLTPLEGLMMGTRAGSFDPGIILRLLRDQRLSAAELAEALDHGSGLLGVSGVSGDVRAVSQAAEAGNQRAALALAIFVRRAAEGIHRRDRRERRAAEGRDRRSAGRAGCGRHRCSRGRR
jgi:acetate kinase